jgi:hypothetical protein
VILVASVGPTVTSPTWYTNSVLKLPKAPAAVPLLRTWSVASIVWPSALRAPDAVRLISEAVGGLHACTQLWSEVGLPVSPDTSEPCTLKDMESPRKDPALTMALVSAPGTVTVGGRPAKVVPHAAPITLQVFAGTMQLELAASRQGTHLTTQFPLPSEVVVTDKGASGPRADVVKVAGVDPVDWALMNAVTITWYVVVGRSPPKRYWLWPLTT